VRCGSIESKPYRTAPHRSARYREYASSSLVTLGMPLYRGRPWRRCRRIHMTAAIDMPNIAAMARGPRLRTVRMRAVNALFNSSSLPSMRARVRFISSSRCRVSICPVSMPCSPARSPRSSAAPVCCGAVPARTGRRQTPQYPATARRCQARPMSAN